MGVADFPSLLGNRSGDQEGYNFDNCETQHLPDRDTNYPRTRKGQKFIEIRRYPGYLNVRDDYFTDDFDDAEGLVQFENASLTLEFMLTPKTNISSPDPYLAEDSFRTFEIQFQDQIYPYVKQTKTNTGNACCDDWELITSYGAIEYFDIGRIFKLENINTEVKPEQIFERFNPETEEVWVRVWYSQVWNGLIGADMTKISDECLVHVAGELGIKNAEHLPVKTLFEYSSAIIKYRYFLNGSDNNLDEPKLIQQLNEIAQVNEAQLKSEPPKEDSEDSREQEMNEDSEEERACQTCHKPMGDVESWKTLCVSCYLASKQQTDPDEPKTCQGCGQDMAGAESWKTFCSNCYQTNLKTCMDCQQTFLPKFPGAPRCYPCYKKQH